MDPRTIVLSVFLVAVALAVLTPNYFFFEDSNRKSQAGNEILVPVEISGGATIFVPAVDPQGRGVVGKFEVQAIPGSGKTLANIEHLLFFVDTQFSIQTAKSVAANVTGVDISRYNLVYDIDVGDDQVRLIEGPSAGAALTIATIAALQNDTLDPEVMITGTIQPDGTIGVVGGVPSKAEAAKIGGARILLVPQGQGLKQTFKPEISCSQVGGLRVCRSEYVPVQALGVNEYGIVVREVASIREALKYFVQ